MPVALSATLAINETIAKKRRGGESVLAMGFGEAGLPIHPALTERLAAEAGRGAYGPVAGSVRLREAAAGYWERRGIATDRDLVVSGPGSKPLLYALILALGGDIVIPAPSWVSYAAQASLSGNQPIFVPTSDGNGGLPDASLMETAVLAARAQGRKVRGVVMTIPDNPTGTLATPDAVRRTCDVARRLNLMIISDEIYRDLVHDPAVPFACPAAYAPERTITTTALSKSLAAGGWRIGVARLPDSPLGRSLHGRLLGVASEIWSSAAAPVQETAAWALSEPDVLRERIEASRRLHSRVVRAVASRFAEAGASVRTPQAAFYCYPDLSGVVDFADAAELAEAMLERYNVGVLPGGEFGDPPAALRLRVATSLLYGETDEQRLAALEADDPLERPWIASALERLEEVLTKISSPVLV